VSNQRRPSSERPRDRLGRPLAFDADPSSIVQQVPARSQVGGAEAWSEALEYLDQDLPFHAHEVFEQRWRCSPADERWAWQLLAQWAAALTHRARGNPVGAQRVAQRALASLDGGPAVPEPVDADLVRPSLVELITSPLRTSTTANCTSHPRV